MLKGGFCSFPLISECRCVESRGMVGFGRTELMPAQCFVKVLFLPYKRAENCFLNSFGTEAFEVRFGESWAALWKFSRSSSVTVENLGWKVAFPPRAAPLAQREKALRGVICVESQGASASVLAPTESPPGILCPLGLCSAWEPSSGKEAPKRGRCEKILYV